MLLLLLLYDIGKWLYCVGEDGVMYIFDTKSGQLENVLQVAGRSNSSSSSSSSSNSVLNISHHPHRNIVVTTMNDQTVTLWKP